MLRLSRVQRHPQAGLTHTLPQPGRSRHNGRESRVFNRMGSTMCYMNADNRDFLLAIVQGLEK